MAWNRDDAKLDRVRALMAEEELDALVVRAPDNVLYLTNFWGMKGYDACVFPREGEPVLITLEASEEDAARTAWTKDVRLIRGYDPEDPRPPLARTLDAAVDGRPGLRARRPRALARHPGRRPHGRRAHDLHGRLVRRLPRGRRRDARSSSAPARSRPRRSSSGCGLRTRSLPRRWITSGSCSGPGCGRRRPPRSGRASSTARAPATTARSSSRSRSRSSGRAAGSRPSPPPATCRSSRASPSCSRSGSAPTATGPTTRRTSSSASCGRTTPSWRLRSWTSTRPRSTRSGPARRWPSSTGACGTDRRHGLCRAADASDLPRRRRARA